MNPCDGIAKGVYFYSTSKSAYLLSNFTASEYTTTSSGSSMQYECFIKVTVMSLYQSIRAALGLSRLITNLLRA